MTQTFTAGQTLTAEAVNAELAFPTGAMLPYAGANAPSQTIGGVEAWLLCDGTAVSRTTYAALFAVLSTTYGTGDGSTTFNLPDFRGRVPVGKGTHADVDGLGDNEGITSANVANRRPKHQHTVYDPGHSHTFSGTTESNSGSIMQDAGGGGNVGWTAGSNMAGTTHTHTFSGSTNSPASGVKVNPGGAASDTASPQDGPAYLVVNYLIKT